MSIRLRNFIYSRCCLISKHLDGNDNIASENTYKMLKIGWWFKLGQNEMDKSDVYLWKVLTLHDIPKERGWKEGFLHGMWDALERLGHHQLTNQYQF